MKLSEKAFSSAIESLSNTLAQQIEATCYEFEISTKATKKRLKHVQYDFSFFRKIYFPHYINKIQYIKTQQPFYTQQVDKRKTSDPLHTIKVINKGEISAYKDIKPVFFAPSNQNIYKQEYKREESSVVINSTTHITQDICPISINNLSINDNKQPLITIDQDSVFHHWLDDTLPAILSNPKGQWVAIAAPRGEAKSTMISLFFVLWAIATNKKQYILLIADTIEQSVSLLESIKSELMSNPRLQHDFPEITGEGRVWNEGTIITCSNVKVQALSAGKRMRGLRHGPYRPDLVILDDLENDEQVRKPEQRDKLQSWLQKTVLNLGSADGSMDVIYIGTVLHYDSVLARILAKSLWKKNIFKAILQWPDYMDLWDQWEVILTEQGEKEAWHFWEYHQKEMLQGAIVSWPTMRPLYLLMKIRAEDHAAFDSEYQNDPLCGDDAPFSQCIHYWSTPPEHWILFGVCDPSLGKHGAGRDPSALLVGGFCQKSMTLYVIEASIKKRHPDRIIEDIIALHRQYKPVLWGVEAVQFQEFFAHVLVQRAEKQGLALPVKPIIHNSDKLLRIESLQPHMVQKHILLSPSQHELIHQLRHFPKADHDDGPDALEMLWRIACSYLSVKEGFIPISSSDLSKIDDQWR